MGDKVAILSPGIEKEQNRLPEKYGRIIRWFIYSITILMVAALLFISKLGLKNENAWMSVSSSACVCLVYALGIYYRFATFPEKQKQLKAHVDSFANLLAFIVLIVTYVTLVFFGKPDNFLEMIATSGAGNIIMGTISGVLMARVLFPFWDLHSKYRRV
ncbi:hypothetical protein [Pantoea septica]|uniref:hypothetical protein n=1 Tax=Pantoea septica TaxID=472695 RepID=UPI001C11D56F|nr:hypothetical protein [Pantoea septica]MBU5377946.1 hypothetical protein [Pantoea septica]